MFLAVSMNVSPLERLETLAEKSCVSAERRLAARLKLVRVRVEFSKKRLKTILPWSAGTFLRLRLGSRLGLPCPCYWENSRASSDSSPLHFRQPGATTTAVA